MRILEAIRSLLDPGIGKVNKLPRREVFELPLPKRWCGCPMSAGERVVTETHTKTIVMPRVLEVCLVTNRFRWTVLHHQSEGNDGCAS